LHSANKRVTCMYNDELVMGAHVYAVMNGTCDEASAWVSCVSVNINRRGHKWPASAVNYE